MKASSKKSRKKASTKTSSVDEDEEADLAAGEADQPFLDPDVPVDAVEGQREDARADQDEEDEGGELRRRVERLRHHPKRQPPAQEREHQRADGAHGAALGRRGDALEDRAEDEEDEDQRRQEVADDLPHRGGDRLRRRGDSAALAAISARMASADGPFRGEPGERRPGSQLRAEGREGAETRGEVADRAWRREGSAQTIRSSAASTASGFGAKTEQADIDEIERREDGERRSTMCAPSLAKGSISRSATPGRKSRMIATPSGVSKRTIIPQMTRARGKTLARITGAIGRAVAEAARFRRQRRRRLAGRSSSSRKT